MRLWKSLKLHSSAWICVTSVTIVTSVTWHRNMCVKAAMRPFIVKNLSIVLDVAVPAFLFFFILFLFTQKSDKWRKEQRKIERMIWDKKIKKLPGGLFFFFEDIENLSNLWTDARRSVRVIFQSCKNVQTAGRFNSSSQPVPPPLLAHPSEVHPLNNPPNMGTHVNARQTMFSRHRSALLHVKIGLIPSRSLSTKEKKNWEEKRAW